MNQTKKKVAFHTLGCKLNFAETSTISRSFPEDQFERVSAKTKADIYVINTCSVTDIADKKCRQTIKKFINQAPEAFIAVVGCYAQLNPLEISAISGVDLVLGSNEKFDTIRYISDSVKKSKPEIHSFGLSDQNGFNPSFSMGDRTRSFLKVQDGCDYRCSYCTIPMARGRSRNPRISQLVDEAGKIAQKGINEVVITGVNIGDFGKSTDESLSALLRELIKIDGIERFRISSIEPDLLSDELIDLAASNKKIMPHFHIPLQSGSDKILGLMRRRYTRDLFEKRVGMIRSKLPLAGIGADIIVGFPGESDLDFENTVRFISDIPLSYLHVFTFSERPGTKAEKMDGRVSFHEREFRSKKLISLSEKKHQEFCNSNIDNISDVLFEHKRNDGMISGFAENYIRVEHPWQAGLGGKILKVRLKEISSQGKMKGELID